MNLDLEIENLKPNFVNLELDMKKPQDNNSQGRLAKDEWELVEVITGNYTWMLQKMEEEYNTMAGKGIVMHMMSYIAPMQNTHFFRNFSEFHMKFALKNLKYIGPVPSKVQ